MTGRGTAIASDPRQARFIIALCLLACLQLALFFWYLSTTIIRQPYWDMYSWVLHYLDFRAQGDWWGYLWAPHDVHRPVWIRLLTAIDIEGFRGVSYPFIVSTTIGHVVTAWLLWRESRAGIDGGAGVVVGLIVLMLLFTSVAAVNCAIPITNGYLHVITFTVVAIVFFDRPESATVDGRASHWRRGLALLAAMSAPLASAVGVAIWPILLFVSWRSGERLWTAIIAAVGLVFMTAYLHGLTIAVGTASAGQTDLTGEFLRRANYLLMYVGLPWTRSAALAIPGRIVGLGLLVAGLWAVTRGVLREPASRLERVAVALVMFSLASAVLAALGRVDVAGHDGVVVPVRYSVLMVPLHVGLLWIAAPAFVRFWNDRRRWPVVAAAVAGACCLLLVQQVVAGQVAVATARDMRATIARFVAGQTDADMTTVIYPDLDQARRELTIIREAGLYLDAK